MPCSCVQSSHTLQPLCNRGWNALLLPFALGPKGRIVRLNPLTLHTAQ
jgi:hypothetical protein